MAWYNPLTWRSAPAPRPFEDVIARLDSNAASASVAGVVVSARQALEVSAVLACVKVLADGCATPALHVFREKPDGTREKALNIPEYRMLNRRPNEWQTSFEFRRTMTLHAALTGNALAVKTMRGNRVAELIPVVPGSFHIDRRGRYDVRYRCYDEFGLIGDFGPDDVLHLPNLQWDALRGLDAVRLAAAAVGLSMAAERNQATLFANGGRPAGILTTDNKLSPEAIGRMREAWASFTGSNRNGTAILDGGFKYSAMAFSGVDAQHLETRRLQIEEICRGYGVFPIMIGHSDKTATFASAEAFFAAHRIQTMQPWWELWCQRLDEFVLDGRGPLFAEFDTRYLMAGSLRDRAQWDRAQIELGIMTRNELRDEYGRDPLPGLDEPLQPLNMSGADAAADGDDDAPA
jgi:HK97 family phage portal protein